MDPMNQDAASGLRLTGEVPRFCAALTAQVEQWTRGLTQLAVLFAVELAALAAGDLLNGILLACSLVILAALEGTMIWVRRRHPSLLAQMRVPGFATPAEARDARWTLVLAFAILLLLPLAVLYYP
jgi:hypothetical protein